MAEVAGRGHPVVTNSWVLNYFTTEARVAYLEMLDTLGRERDLSWVYAESPAQIPGLPVPEHDPQAEITVLSRGPVAGRRPGASTTSRRATRTGTGCTGAEKRSTAGRDRCSIGGGRHTEEGAMTDDCVSRPRRPLLAARSLALARSHRSEDAPVTITDPTPADALPDEGGVLFDDDFDDGAPEEPGDRDGVPGAPAYDSGKILQARGIDYPSSTPIGMKQLYAFLSGRWGGKNLGILSVPPRPMRGGSQPSLHCWGMALDWSWESPGRAAADEVIEFLLANTGPLAIQAVHDYERCRYWKSYNGWNTATKSSSTGFGQSWARWLHVERTWAAANDARSIDEALRAGGGQAPTGTRHVDARPRARRRSRTRRSRRAPRAPTSRCCRTSCAATASPTSPAPTASTAPAPPKRSRTPRPTSPARAGTRAPSTASTAPAPTARR